jgi:hypothetical protein
MMQGAEADKFEDRVVGETAFLNTLFGVNEFGALGE